jgi:hypothetical protein
VCHVGRVTFQRCQFAVQTATHDAGNIVMNYFTPYGFLDRAHVFRSLSSVFPAVRWQNSHATRAAAYQHQDGWLPKGDVHMFATAGNNRGFCRYDHSRTQACSSLMGSLVVASRAKFSIMLAQLACDAWQQNGCMNEL